MGHGIVPPPDGDEASPRRDLLTSAHRRLAPGRLLAWWHEDDVVGELPHQGVRIVREPRLQESLATSINRLLTHVFPL